MGSALIGRVLIKPAPLIIPEIRCEHIEIHRHKLADLLLALHQDGQGRRLNAPHGQQRIVLQGKGAAGVHADQPVRLRAAQRAAVQAVIMRGGHKRVKALADRGIGQGADPQPLYRLGTPGMLIYQAEDQFALPAGVRRAHQGFRLPVQHQLLHDGVLAAGFGDHLGADLIRQNRQILPAPFLEALIDLIGFLQGDQMAQRPGDPVGLGLEPSLFAGTLEHTGNVPRNAGLFRDNQFHEPTFLIYNKETKKALLSQRGGPCLLRGDSVYRTDISASTTFNADIRIDFELGIPLRNRVGRALGFARAAADASIRNLVCHAHPLRFSAFALYYVPIVMQTA